jgi:Ca2+-binding EF-hand superfamily protein
MPQTPLDSVKMGTQLRHLIVQNLSKLRKAFRVADPKGTGYLSEGQFRSAIYHTVGLPVSMLNIKETSCYSVESGRVEYERWLRSFLGTVHQDSYHEAADATVFDHLHKLVVSNYAVVITKMKAYDVDPTDQEGMLVNGVARRDGFIEDELFKQILMHEAGVSHEELLLLFRNVPTHYQGEVQYEAFVKKFVEDPYNAVHTFHEYYRPISSRVPALPPPDFALIAQQEAAAAAAAAERERQAMLAMEEARRMEEARMHEMMAQREAAEAEAVTDDWIRADAERAAFIQAEAEEEMQMRAAASTIRPLLPVPPPPGGGGLAPPVIPQSNIRREIAKDLHDYLENKPPPEARAMAAAYAAHIPRSQDLPAPSLQLTPRDHMESLHRFHVSSQSAYVDKINTDEKDQLLNIEKEAKALTEQAKHIGDPMGAASAKPMYGVHPGVDTNDIVKAQREDNILGRIYKGQPELYSRLYAGELGAPRYTADAAVVHRDLQKTTDLASRLDILRNTPMDPIRKIELLQELRGANNLGVDIGDVLASATRIEAQRGYGAPGARVGGNSDPQAANGAIAPAKAPLSGNRTSRFIVG